MNCLLMIMFQEIVRLNYQNNSNVILLHKATYPYLMIVYPPDTNEKSYFHERGIQVLYRKWNGRSTNVTVYMYVRDAYKCLTFAQGSKEE